MDDGGWTTAAAAASAAAAAAATATAAAAAATAATAAATAAAAATSANPQELGGGERRRRESERRPSAIEALEQRRRRPCGQQRKMIRVRAHRPQAAAYRTAGGGGSGGYRASPSGCSSRRDECARRSSGSSRRRSTASGSSGEAAAAKSVAARGRSTTTAAAALENLDSSRRSRLSAAARSLTVWPHAHKQRRFSSSAHARARATMLRCHRSSENRRALDFSLSMTPPRAHFCASSTAQNGTRRAARSTSTSNRSSHFQLLNLHLKTANLELSAGCMPKLSKRARTAAAAPLRTLTISARRPIGAIGERAADGRRHTNKSGAARPPINQTKSVGANAARLLADRQSPAAD